MRRRAAPSPFLERGRWILTPDETLVFTRNGLREEALLRGRIFSAGASELTAAVRQAQNDQLPTLRTVTLGGKWSLDSSNRLAFTVARKDGKKDALTFRGAWRTGPRNEIVYLYKEGKKAFSLAGEWLLEGHALAYRLETGDVLRVRGEFGTDSIRAKDGALRYRIGIEGRRGRRVRAIVLRGTWKIGRDLGVEFELEGARGRKPVLKFGAVYAWSAGKLRASVTGSDGRPVGFEVLFERPLPGGAQAFARLRRSTREALAEAGLSFRW